MKRLRQWLFNFAAGFSLLLVLFMAVLWVRSDWVSDYFAFHPDVTDFQRLDLYLFTRPGEVGFGRKVFFWTPAGKADGLRIVAETRRLHRWEYEIEASPDPLPLMGHLWFNWWSAIDTTMAPGTTSMEARLRIPDWFLIFLSLILPAIWLANQNRRKRAVGCCVYCGYDLRATPDRCPECGNAPKRTSA